MAFLPTIIYRGDNYYELIYNLTLTIAFLIQNSALSLCISHVGFSSCSYLLISAFLYCFAYLLHFLPRKTSPGKLPSTSLHLEMMPSANLSALIMVVNLSRTMSEAHNRGSQSCYLVIFKDYSSTGWLLATIFQLCPLFCTIIFFHC